MGSGSIYDCKIARVAKMVKRVKETDDHGSVAIYLIEVEIELDDPSGIPQLLGREAHVTFL
jgi:HlyD family secretion protein